ncbi:MAG: spherulation-specific family 4 protein [Acidovorax sp.]
MKTLTTPSASLRVASLLALTAALSACGGGGDSNNASAPAPAPVPAGPLGISFTVPTASQNVLDLGSSTTLVMNASVSGGPVPNGTSVLLTTTPAATATLSPVSPTTVGGTATSVLSATPLGSLVVNAAVTSSSQAASANLQIYTRVKPQPLQVLVPAYFSTSTTSSTTTSPWTTLANGVTSYPNVVVTAIINPSGGTGLLTSTSKADSTITKAITAFQAASSNAKVIGYIGTNSGNGSPSLADIKTTIDTYISLYPTLSGFFLDNMAVSANQLSFYMQIYQYIKAKSASYTVVGNPGTFPDSNYATVTDTLVTYSGTGAGYQGIDPQAGGNTWVYNEANTAQAMMVNSVITCNTLQGAIATANLPRTNTGMVYVTDQPESSPWSTLPSYWTALLNTVDAYNTGRTKPAC